MQRNLKWGWVLTFSLVALWAVLSACGKVPIGVRQTASDSRTENEDSFHESVVAPPGGVTGSRSERASADEAVRSAGTSVKSEGKRLEIDVPPPPLGLVPISSPRSSSKSTAAIEFEDDNPANVSFADNKTSDSSGHTAGEVTRTTNRDPGDRFQVAHSTASRPATRTASASSSTRSQREIRVAGRKSEPTEQELRAQKIIHERAAELARQRQARLAARRHGSASRPAARAWTQTAQSRLSLNIGAETVFTR